jgi:hypothetical protein
MRTLCEARWIKEGIEDDETPLYETRQYWLLHFGLKYDLITTEEGKMVAVNYTVCVCEDYETGELRLLNPEQIRILGRQIKE